MKKIYILLFVAFSLLSLDLFAQAPDWLWARTSQALGNDIGNSVCVDGSGNSYFFGEFRSISFQFGPTVLSNTNGAGTTRDLFLAKLDFAGMPLWLKKIGGSGNEYAWCVSADASGNSYVTGSFGGPSVTIGTLTFTNQGSDDIFFAKYDASGNVLWAKGIGGSGSESGISIDIDANGFVYLAGSFSSPSITFGTTTLNRVGSNDIFVVKYDNAGNVIWAKSAGGINSELCYGLSVDAIGNSYITGYFASSTFTFGSTTLYNNGSDDYFIAKYDASGNPVWAKSAGGTSYDNGLNICADASGNTVSVGVFTSPTLTFGTTTLINSGADDIFIVKYDESGNLIWAKSVGTPGSEWCLGVCADVNGNSYITGYFNNPTITFGTYTLNNVGQSDVFTAKFDANGNVVWANSVGNTSGQGGNSICVDGNQNTYIAGYYYGTSLTFGTYTINNLQGSGTTSEAFIAKQNIGFPGIPATPVGPNSLCLNPPNSNYTTSGAGGAESYIWSVNPVGAGTISGTGLTGTVNWNDTYTGTAQITVKGHNILGDGQPSLPCIVTISPLTIAGFVTGGSNICLGNSTGILTLSGNTGLVNKWQKRLNSGTWIDIANTLPTYSEIPSSAGSWEYRAEVQSGACTSAFSSSTTVIVVQPVAGSVSGGSTICLGNSTGTLTLSGHIGTITKWQKRLNAGTWIDIANNSTTYSEIPSSIGSWDYRAEIQNNGCTAFSLSTSVIVNALPPTPTITQNLSILTSDAPAGNQWYRNNSIIPGATGQSYTCSQNGDYFDIVTLNGCSSDTSNVITILNVGLEFIENNKTFKVYPNPVSNELIIEIAGSKEEIAFEILNSIGQVVFKGKMMEKMVVNTKDFAAGVYIIKFGNGSVYEFRKILKE